MPRATDATVIASLDSVLGGLRNRVTSLQRIALRGQNIVDDYANTTLEDMAHAVRLAEEAMRRGLIRPRSDKP